MRKTEGKVYVGVLDSAHVKRAMLKTAEKVATIAYEQGMRQAEVVITGPGSGRETAIRALQGCGLQVLVLKDKTPVPHNGCRPPKKRRV